MDYTSYNFDHFQSGWAPDPATAPMHETPAMPILGSLLIQMGAVTPERLREALETHADSRLPLAHVLITQGVCTPQQVAAALAYRPQYG